MRWTIKQIQENSGLPLEFSLEVDVASELMERESDILDVSMAKVTGALLYDHHSVIATCQTDVTVTLPSSRTLQPVPVRLTIESCERYVENGYVSQYAQEAKDEVIIPLESTVVDLTESIVDNILLNLPIQVLSADEAAETDLPSGEGWVLYTEDAYNVQKQKEKEETVDPRFAGLKALLDEKE